jgi:Proteasome subunit
MIFPNIISIFFFFTIMKTTGNSRPFGVSFIVAGIDSVLGHQLYVLDPEGSVNAWNTVCIGKDSDKVMETFLEIFAKTTENKDLSVVETWPKFRACLRKHFPGKLEASASIRKLRLEAKRINTLIGLENSGEKKLGQDIGDEIIRHPAYEPVSDSSNKSDHEDNSIEYWDLEVTSLMLDSQNEVYLGSLQFPLESSSDLQNEI